MGSIGYKVTSLGIHSFLSRLRYFANKRASSPIKVSIVCLSPCLILAMSTIRALHTLLNVHPPSFHLCLITGSRLNGIRLTFRTSAMNLKQESTPRLSLTSFWHLPFLQISMLIGSCLNLRLSQSFSHFIKVQS